MNQTFWHQLAGKQKPEIEILLTKKLGQPHNELNNNLFQELVRKIVSYHVPEPESNYTTYSLVGLVTEISDKKHKTGKNKGQVFYNLKLGGNPKETLQARKELLPADKWQQITKLAILGKNLVFKYRKWITNKQVLDFWEEEKRRGKKG